MALTDGLIYYSKYDTNGSFPDSVGSNDGTINWATYTASWIINWGYSFATNDWITLSNITVSNVFTINIRVNFTVSSSWGDYMFFARTTASSTDRVYMYNINWNIVFAVWATAGAAYSWYDDGGWHMLTIIKNGSTQKTYIDNVEKDSLSDWNTINTLANIALWRLELSWLQYYTGTQDELGIRNRDISTSELTELYNAWAGIQYPFTSAQNAIFFGCNF